MLHEYCFRPGAASLARVYQSRICFLLPTSFIVVRIPWNTANVSTSLADALCALMSGNSRAASKSFIVKLLIIEGAEDTTFHVFGAWLSLNDFNGSSVQGNWPHPFGFLSDLIRWDYPNSSFEVDVLPISIPSAQASRTGEHAEDETINVRPPTLGANF